MAEEVRMRFFHLLMRVAFVFEPLAPRLLSYYTRRTLKKWKQENRILGYTTRSRRLGKYHYKTQIDLSLSSEQTAHVLERLTRRTMD